LRVEQNISFLKGHDLSIGVKNGPARYYIRDLGMTIMLAISFDR